jgi:hypothetical protein
MPIITIQIMPKTQIAAGRIRNVEHHHSDEKRAKQRACRKGCNPRDAKRERRRRGNVQMVGHGAVRAENSMWFEFETSRWLCSSPIFSCARISALPGRAWVARMVIAGKPA